MMFYLSVLLYTHHTLFSLVGSSETIQYPCDFISSETGCEDVLGSVCDPQSNVCQCKPQYPVRLLSYCLQKKSIGEDCFTSSQCSQIKNAACFIFGKEYDNERFSGGHNVGRNVYGWPSGICRCHIGYQYDNLTDSCIKRTIGSWCNDWSDCIKHTFNSYCKKTDFLCDCSWGFFYDPLTDTCNLPQLFGTKCLADEECSKERLSCLDGRCACPVGHHYDTTYANCKPNDDSSCEYGYKWDEEWGRCIPSSRSSTLQIHRPKQVDSETAVLAESDDSSYLKTILIFAFPNTIAFGLLVRYCYYKKQDERIEREEDIERGLHITEKEKEANKPSLAISSATPANFATVMPNESNGIKKKDDLPLEAAAKKSSEAEPSGASEISKGSGKHEEDAIPCGNLSENMSKKDVVNSCADESSNQGINK